jgi:hypothetical protein
MGNRTFPLDITYEKRKAIKSQIMSNFTAEWLELQNTGPPDLLSVWTMYFDGSKRVEGAGAGVSRKHQTMKLNMRLCCTT